VKNVTDPKIEWPTDVLVRITSSNICGSDLHMYEGRTDMEEGKVFGRNATLKIYAGAPHGLAYTHKDQLNVDLLAFLKTEELSR